MSHYNTDTFSGKMGDENKEEELFLNFQSPLTYNNPSGSLTCHHLLSQSGIVEDHNNISNAGDKK